MSRDLVNMICCVWKRFGLSLGANLTRGESVRKQWWYFVGLFVLRGHHCRGMAFRHHRKRKRVGETRKASRRSSLVCMASLSKYEYVELRQICYIAMFAAVSFLRLFVFSTTINSYFLCPSLNNIDGLV